MDEFYILKELEELAVNETDIDIFVKKIQELVSIASVSQGSMYSPGITLYRTTNHHVFIPSKISDLWYPPKEFAKLSRANRGGNPMFYCSSDPNCTFWELGVAKNQFFVHAKWITTEEMMLHDLGYCQEVFSRAKTKREVPIQNQKFEVLNFTEIRKYIHLAFTEESERRYPLTAAIAEVHLNADFVNGIKYPSIKKNGSADNIALLPNFVNRGLKLSEATFVKVDQLKDDYSVGGVIIADLEKVEEDGSLIWKFRKKGVPVKPGESIKIRPGRYTMQASGEIVIGNNTYPIRPGYTLEISNFYEILLRDLKGNTVKPLTKILGV